ncbi:Hypothetical protein PBC10988_28450 [Planctomycetales bacterium 10988]|nr:Hypothetical protein PBC10988_28450 [Planctomycetales bacterium 10988]
MRLTLRSLLAFRDGLLTMAQMQEIDQKLQDNPSAQALNEKINRCLQNKQLGTPAPCDPELSQCPDQVARYLDNALEEGEVVDIEKACLGSKIHLAEVAGCQKILVEILQGISKPPRSVREAVLAKTAETAQQRCEPLSPVC